MNLGLNVALLVFLGVVIFLSLLQRKTSSSRKLYLLRALFPSWQFFDQAGSQPALWYRSGSSPEKLSPWQPTPSPPARTLKNFWWRTLFLNPVGNLHFATDSLLHQLIADAPENNSDDFSRHPSYLLVRAWVESLIPPQDAFLQFRVDLLTPDEVRPERYRAEKFLQSSIERRTPA